MKAATVVAALLMASACRSNDERRVHALLPDDPEITRLVITLEEDALESLDASPKKWVKGDLTHGKYVYERVAVRLKGNRSRRDLDGKASFKLSFSKYEKGRRFNGLKALTLNSMVEDPTMMREALAYRIHAAMGVAVPRTSYAEVFLNEDYLGLYLMIEPIDRGFATRRGSGEDTIYEGEYGCDLYPGDVGGFDQDAGDDETRADLMQLATAAQVRPRALFHGPDPLVDRDRVLSFLAASALIGDFDGYHQSHNYFLRHDVERGRWELIPWGLDRTFSSRLDLFSSGGVLAKACFVEPDCRRAYVARVREGVQIWRAMELPQKFDALRKRIDHSARTDPRKEASTVEMRQAQAALFRYLRNRPEQVHAILAATPHKKPATTCAQLKLESATFQLCDGAMTWQEAKTFCEGSGWSLAEIRSKAESKALYDSAMKRRNTRWWIGLSDATEEDTFAWTNGKRVDFSHWGRGEPDNFGCNQDCVTLANGKDGRWHDNHCGHRFPFVCRATP